MTIFLILFAMILGYITLHLSHKIISNYPCSWVDIICKKTPKYKHNISHNLLFSFFNALFIISLLYRYNSLSNLTLFAIILILFFLITIAVIDWKINIIPDILIIPSLLISFGIIGNLPWINGGLNEAVIAGIIGYVLPIISGICFYKKSSEAIGGGDFKLLAWGGLFMGIMGLSITVVISAILSCIYCKKNNTNTLPYAPFFVIGLLIAIFI